MRLLNLKMTLLTVVLTALAATTVSCDNEDPTKSVTLSDIVVMKSTGDNGSVFELQLPESSETITLTSTSRLDTTKVKPDRCIYLRYTPVSGKPYCSGEIIVNSYAAITNIEATSSTPAEVGDWNHSPVYLMSCRPMLGRVIIYAGLAYPVEKRRLTIAVNQQSVSQGEAEAWLVHEAETLPSTYMADFYVAVDMRAELEKLKIDRLTLNVANSNLKEDKINLNFKSNQ